MIERQSRRNVALTCWLVACGSLTLLPLAARSSLRAIYLHRQQEPAVAPTSDNGPWNAKAVTVGRDPFISEAANAGASSAVIGERVVPGQLLGSIQTGGAVVRAIATGPVSRAVIDIGGLTRIVGVGDRIGGLRVTAIGSDRVQLSGGSRLVLRTHP